MDTNNTNAQRGETPQNTNEPTEAQWREVHDAEINAMTFTLPGGEPMKLHEIAAHRAAQDAAEAEGMAANVRMMEEENEERRLDHLKHPY